MLAITSRGAALLAPCCDSVIFHHIHTSGVAKALKAMGQHLNTIRHKLGPLQYISLMKLMVALHAVVHVFQPKEYTVLIKSGDAVNLYITFDHRKLEMH